MKKSELAILIPAFNESKTIFSVIKKIERFGTPIVIDDGSSDNTFNLAKKAGATVIKHKTNLGYDESLNTGFLTACENNCKYVITFDADDQHDSKLIPIFIDLLYEGNIVVCGVRKKKPRFSELLFSIYTNIRWGIKDPLCGMKGYSIDLYKELGHFDSYNSIGTELLLFSLSKNYSVKQVPIPIKRRQDLPRLGSLARANIKILTSLMRHLI
tara:strand:+ start:98 stop:736 length:639 start_codon:yes stop_codon:yes gene_type:complete